MPRLRLIIVGLMNNNPKSKDKYLFYLLRLDDNLLNYLAEKLEIRVYNSKFRFLEKFDKNRYDEYERFRGVVIQKMINYLLRSEFNLELFKKQGLLLDAFPLHDFTERSQISHTWKQENKLKKIIKWNDLWFWKKARIDHLKPLTACAFYYGTPSGWYLTFLSSLTTDLLIPGLIFIPFAILNTKYFPNDNSAYIPYLSIIITIW